MENVSTFSIIDDLRIHCELPDPYPSSYIVAMHITSVFSCVLNVLTLYCILKRSPRVMNEYKSHLLVYQLVAFTFDIYGTVLTTPVFFLPVPMWYPAGLLSNTNIDVHLLTVIGVYFAIFMAVMILEIFFYRYQVALPPGNILKLNKWQYITLYAVVISLIFLLSIFGESQPDTDQEHSKEYIRQMYDCFDAILLLPKIQVYLPVNVQLLAFIFTGLIVLIASIVLLLVSLIHRAIRRSNFSAITLRMHRRALTYLIVQTVIPLLAIGIPAGMISYLIRTQYFMNRILIHVIMSLFFSHGMLGSICLLLIVKPYRVFILSKLRCLRLSKDSTFNTNRNSIAVYASPDSDWHDRRRNTVL